MKELAEGLLLCMGVGFMYLGASAADTGNVVGGAVMACIGFCFLALMLAVAVERR